MRRATFVALGVAALATIASVAPASAKYGAIAYNENNGRRGVAWNFDTQRVADETALRDCGTGCKVVVRFGPKMCFAIATPDKGKGIGAASRRSITEAKAIALADCKKHSSGDCIVRDARCNR
jgi:Domain of unknown function (DUF4189)